MIIQHKYFTSWISSCSDKHNFRFWIQSSVVESLQSKQQHSATLTLDVMLSVKAAGALHFFKQQGIHIFRSIFTVSLEPWMTLTCDFYLIYKYRLLIVHFTLDKEKGQTHKWKPTFGSNTISSSGQCNKSVSHEDEVHTTGTKYCRYQHQYKNRVYICFKCYDNGKRNEVCNPSKYMWLP